MDKIQIFVDAVSKCEKIQKVWIYLHGTVDSMADYREKQQLMGLRWERLHVYVPDLCDSFLT